MSLLQQIPLGWEKQMTIALIDADIIAYRIGFTTENVSLEDIDIVEWRIDTFIQDIDRILQPEKVEFYLTSTDKSNFRFNIYSQYKANRKAEKPRHYEYIRDYLINSYGAEVVFGMEADDMLSIRQYECFGNSVICSIDKDLLQVPGDHYNFVTGTKNYISVQEGLANFYKQLLVGDSGDNIPGCPGIGEAKSNKLVIADMSELDMYEVCYKTYKEQYKKKKIPWDFVPDMLRNGNLLKLKTTRDEEEWQFPNVSLAELKKTPPSSIHTEEIQKRNCASPAIAK